MDLADKNAQRFLTKKVAVTSQRTPKTQAKPKITCAGLWSKRSNAGIAALAGGINPSARISNDFIFCEEGQGGGRRKHTQLQIDPGVSFSHQVGFCRDSSTFLD